MTELTFLKSTAATTIRAEAKDYALETLPLSIPALFNGGARGDYFVADRQHLFQDRAATTPVVGDGDPVRAIRGSVNGYVAAVAADADYYTFRLVNGVGFLENRPGTSKAFLLPKATMPVNSLIGRGSFPDTGWLIAGRAQNIFNVGPSSYAEFGLLTSSGGNISLYHYQQTNLYVEPYSFTMAPTPPASSRVFIYGQLRATEFSAYDQTTPTEWRVLQARHEGVYYVKGRNSQEVNSNNPRFYSGSDPDIDYPLEGFENAVDHEVSGNGVNTALGLYLFGYQTSSAIGQAQMRSVLCVSGPIDPTLHSSILEAL